MKQGYSSSWPPPPPPPPKTISSSSQRHRHRCCCCRRPEILFNGSTGCKTVQLETMKVERGCFSGGPAMSGVGSATRLGPLQLFSYAAYIQATVRLLNNMLTLSQYWPLAVAEQTTKHDSASRKQQMLKLWTTKATRIWKTFWNFFGRNGWNFASSSRSIAHLNTMRQEKNLRESAHTLT